MMHLSEAAERTGRTKQAIRKAVASGRVRGEKDALGQWLVDPASLFAVYQPVGANDANRTNQVDGAEIEGLRRLIAMLESERDHLRHRLDQSEQERRDKDRQLTALLTDQRPPWWRRFAPRSGAQRRT